MNVPEMRQRKLREMISSAISSILFVICVILTHTNSAQKMKMLCILFLFSIFFSRFEQECFFRVYFYVGLRIRVIFPRNRMIRTHDVTAASVRELRVLAHDS